MGTVQAKSVDDSSNASLQLPTINARVDRIHVDGLGRTKDDIVISCVKDLFAARDFSQVIVKVQEVHNRLVSLGIFKNVGVFIDVSRGPGASSDGLEVTFSVQEQRMVSGGVSTLVGNNEGSLVLGLKLPNVAGRGEKIQAEYAHGTSKTSGFNVTLSKPFVNAPNWWQPLITGAIFQQNAEFPFSGFNETDRGALLELAFDSAPTVRHHLRWEGVWRELRILTSARSFAIREEMGHSLKSSVKHTLLVDRRDGNVFPNRGAMFRLQQELAGLGGDIGFLKNELELQANFKLPFDCVLQGSVIGGVMLAHNNNKVYNVSDRFFLGGPLTLRGFYTRGAGPHDEGCATGSDTYWTGALHLYTPLPFNPLRGGIGERFRMHMFANAGNIDVSHSGDYQQLIQNLWDKRRWSVGLGLVVQFAQHARIEINYCVPMTVHHGDKTCHGLQFGIGVTYV